MKQPLKKHITAVVKTIKMWEWLKEYYQREKEDYFDKFNLSCRYTEKECYLCYYFIDSVRLGNCGECPLSTKNHRCCARDRAQFHRWYRTSQKTIRDRNAQKIVDLCKEWLTKYNIEFEKEK